MSALLVGETASIAVLGLSPWVIPLIAMAAKLTYDQTRNACRRDDRPSDQEDTGPKSCPRDREVVPELLKANLAGK